MTGPYAPEPGPPAGVGSFPPSGSSIFRTALRGVLNPGVRYRNAKFIHAARIALGILISFAVTIGLNIPHGEWTAISFLIVIAGLQHHGTIRRRAVERCAGTAIGAIAGLVVIVQQEYLGIMPLTWLLMACFCGVCAYYAIGKAGYVALLSAITLIIVAGHGTDPLSIGFWRAVNVFIGIVIALALTSVLPIYAAWSWRYKFAEALRECGTAYGTRDGETAPSSQEEQRAMATINAILLELRALLPSVAQESGVSVATLEAIQHRFRIIISSLELVLAAPSSLDGNDGRHRAATLAESGPDGISAAFHQLSLMLEFGPPDHLGPATEKTGGSPPRSEAGEPSSLAFLLNAELMRLRRELIQAPALWKV
ncbi:MAG TPA: FUSC family protein [Acetobacteraceae bacterium]|nr:FUSC family protein [Acetobacteraceae bacterium]